MWNDPNFFNNLLRSFFAMLDNIGYFFLGGIYDIFFTVANAKIFQGDLINTFYSRIQMILGILMIFKLSITVLQIILNPDMFKDKQKGAGSIVMRLALIIVMLSLIVPIDIPTNTANKNPLNEQIKANGILFGFLYQIQNSIVDDNILGKLVLGYNVDNTADDKNSNGLELNNMASVGDVITAQIARAFIRPTLSSSEKEDEFTDEKDYEKFVACNGDEANAYFNENLTSGTLLDHINDTCESDDGEVYVFDYTGFGGVVCSIIMTIIILGFTLDVAVRAIKLALLRLIAPIPIISYITPGAEKDGAFGNWVKTLTSTYISLFVRLVIIYFGIYLIILLRSGDLVTLVGSSSVFTTTLANVFIIVGILVFMKQAPKFFQDMLGIKGDGNLFSGIGTMLGAAALTGGLLGSVATNARSSFYENKERGKGTIKSTLGAIGSGVAGGIGGAFVGGKALAASDKKHASAVFAAMQKRNAVRASGSTLFGRAQAGASALVTGRALGAADEKKLELYDAFVEKAKAQIQMAESEALNDNKIMGNTSVMEFFTDENGKRSTRSININANYRDFETRFQNARARGDKTFTFAGHEIELDSINENTFESLKKSQARVFASQQRNLSPDKKNPKFAGTTQDLEYVARNLQIDIDPYDYDVNDNKSVKKSMGNVMNKARDIRTSSKRNRYIANSKQINGGTK